MTARRSSTQATNASQPASAPKSTRRGRAANANPPAEVAPATTPEVDPLLTMLGGVALPGTKTPKAKAEAVKAQARRDLAQFLVSAYAEAFATLPADSPIFAALGRDAAAQFASNWVHHLPVTADAFGENLPLPARSNWDGATRK